jgi:N-acetylmuramoyl-L-alanine amidase
LAFGATANAIRLHDHTTHTRFVVECSAPVEFKIRRLTNPYRLAIDVPGLSWSVPRADKDAVGLISGVHYGSEASVKNDIILDVTGPVRVARSFVLPATATTPTRLVVDVEATTQEAFLADMAAEGHKGRKVAVAAQAPRAKVEVVRKKIIVLDPGHGGADPGAIGQSGTYEKHITLAAARQLKKRLEATGRYKVVLTRDEDEALALRRRTEIAHDAAADLFISLHADSIQNPAIRGLSVYTLSDRASDAEAEALANHENKADIIIGMDLSNETVEVRNILVDLAQRESRNLATRLAGKLITELQREVRLLPNTHRFAGFAVLKSPDIPSVLIEMGYLSNRIEETALKKESYRSKLISAIVRGIDQHFSQTVVARQM